MIDVLLQVFPSGAYNTDEGTPTRDSLEAEAAILGEADGMAEVLNREILPNTAVDTIDAWEELLGIIPPEGATLEERQAFAAAWLAQSADLSKGHMEHLSKLILGYVPVIRGLEIVRAAHVYYPTVGSARLGPIEWIHTWHIDIDPDQTDIDTYERSRLEQVIDSARPAWSIVHIGFAGPFKVGISQVGKDKLGE